MIVAKLLTGIKKTPNIMAKSENITFSRPKASCIMRIMIGRQIIIGNMDWKLLGVKVESVDFKSLQGD